MRAGFWILGLALALSGCQNKSTSSPTKASAITSAALAEPVATAVATVIAPKSYPSDLVLDEIVTKLDCAKGATKNACAVCDEFRHGERFTGNTPSGEGRWFGRAHVVEKGQERSEYMLLVSRHVPTARVGPSSLPLMISMATFAIELQSEAARLWTKMNHGLHRGNRRNQAFRFLDSYDPNAGQNTGQEAINTTGASVQLIAPPTEDIGYLRQISVKKLLLVRPARGLNAAPGDGTYAEFWQAVW